MPAPKINSLGKPNAESTISLHIRFRSAATEIDEREVDLLMSMLDEIVQEMMRDQPELITS